MFGTACRWITKTRRRGICCILFLIALLITIPIVWREFCIWRVQSSLALRLDGSARRWLGLSCSGIFPDARIYLFRSKLDRRSGHFSEIGTMLEEAKKRGAPNSELSREQALVRAQSLRFDSFTKEDWANLIADPRDDEPEIAKAYIAWANSRFQFDDAARMLSVWELDYPNDPDPQFLRGQVFSAMSNWNAAEQCFRKAVQLAPNRADIQASLATALKQQFQLDEAIYWYREARRNEPGSTEIEINLAQSLLTNGDLDAARQIIDDALKIQPGNTDLHQVLGEVLMAGGNAHDAIEPLQRAYAAHPESASLAYVLASALQADGHQDDAKQLFAFTNESREPLAKLQSLNEQMVRTPNDVEVRYQIGVITAKYSSRDAAKRWFQNLLRINPRHRPTHLALAEIYRSTGDEVRAKQHFDIAKALDR